MITTQKHIVDLDIRDQKYNKTCGNGLLINVESKKKGSTKSFVGRSRFRGKQIETRIGVFGSYPDQFSLKKAHETWLDIKEWSKKEDQDPRDFYKQKKLEIRSRKTLEDAVHGYLNDKKTIIKETTHKEYTYKLHQVLGKINKNTFLEDLEWDRGGRRVVMQAMKGIEEDRKFDLRNRCQSLLSQVFDFAIREGWMQRFQNPAMKLKGEKSTHKTEHHPTIKWEDVPELLHAINLNKCNSQHQVVLSVKLLLMTFLRAGALTRLEWEWIDDDKKMLIIPAKTSGLKRKKGVNDDIDHHLPLTKEMYKVLENAKEFSGGMKYIFQPLMQSRYPHLDPSAPNNFLRNIGYKDSFRAHGWRRTALTAGIDIFKTDKEVIRKQMGHLPEGKVEKAYNESLLLDERRMFLEKWTSSLVDQGLKI